MEKQKTTQELWKTLTEVAEELNSQTNALMESLRSIEQSLERMNIGVEASVSNDKFVLSYGRWHSDKGAKKWCLILSNPKDESYHWPLLTAPRHLRIEAVELIPDLLEEMNKQIQPMVASLQLATNKVTTFLEAINDAKASQEAD